MTSFINSFIQQLLKLFPSRFSSRTLLKFTYLHGLQVFKKVGNGVVVKLLETVPMELETWCCFCSQTEKPSEFQFSISCWNLLRCSVCLDSYWFYEVNQGSCWAEAVNSQFAFTLPYFILHVTTRNWDLGSVQETVESPHQTEKPSRNDIRDVHIRFTFLFTHPSRSFTDCRFSTPIFPPSRFPSRTFTDYEFSQEAV